MRLVILGIGGHGQTVADVASQTEKYSEILFLDDNADNAAGKCADYIHYIDNCTEIYPAFGNNTIRLQWAHKLLTDGAKLPKIIHPLAYVSPKAIIADGCVLLPYAIVNTLSVVDKACIINCGAIVDHGCIIEEGVHVSPGAIIKAENRIPSGMKVESGVVIPIREYPL